MLTKNSCGKNGRSVPLALAMAGALLLGTAGCISKEFTYKSTVAGGEELTFTLTGSGPAHARAESFEVLDAALVPDFPAKTIFYKFRLSDSQRGKSLQSLRIEDVTDTEALLVFEDQHPAFTERVWEGKTGALSLEEPSLQWLSYVSDSMRIYRFTLTMADGRKVVLHQLAMMPGWVKTKIREMFGQKY
jgi:hypothetical protein